MLMDAGCEYNGYVSDITRTWPISGKFTEEQKTLYEIVLRVQMHCIEVGRLNFIVPFYSLWPRFYYLYLI